jgi:carbon storage regulator CsrA
LVLGRKLNERIIIDGGRIVLTVVRLKGDQVRLGFVAGRDVVIHREETQVKIDRDARRGGGPRA